MSFKSSNQRKAVMAKLRSAANNVSTYLREAHRERVKVDRLNARVDKFEGMGFSRKESVMLVELEEDTKRLKNKVD